jgi:hypothetical protein
MEANVLPNDAAFGCHGRLLPVQVDLRGDYKHTCLPVGSLYYLKIERAILRCLAKCPSINYVRQQLQL